MFECFRGRYLPGTLVSRALATASDRCSGSVTLYLHGRSLFPRVVYDCFDAGFVATLGPMLNFGSCSVFMPSRSLSQQKTKMIADLRNSE